MTDWIQAWQCIGCGKIEAPQPCIGVCRDRRIFMVGKDEHEQVQAELAIAQQQLQELQAVLRQLAWSQPREGQWERCWRVLQQRAREWIAEPGEHATPVAGPGSPIDRV